MRGAVRDASRRLQAPQSGEGPNKRWHTYMRVRWSHSRRVCKTLIAARVPRPSWADSRLRTMIGMKTAA